jgi:hypothetical protein
VFRPFWGFVVLVFFLCAGIRFCFTAGHGCSPRVAAGQARGSTGRGSPRAGRFCLLLAGGQGSGSVEAGCEDGDLRFPGEGLLGGGGVPEFGAGLLLALGVPLPVRGVEGMSDSGSQMGPNATRGGLPVGRQQAI